jgi:phage/plasmid-associated DNA primase
MREYTDIKQVNGFIKNEMGITYRGVARYDYLSHTDATELDQIKRFKDIYKRKLKYFPTAHHLTRHKWGRVVPANYLSLAILHRPTRHSFCDDIYRDIDMVNAQPTIINEIAKMNGITLEWLPTYVKNTKKYREFIMSHHDCSKDCAKNLPIVLMMGGSYDSWIKDWDIEKNIEPEELICDIEKLEKELKGIKNIVYVNNQHIKRDVMKHDPQKWVKNPNAEDAEAEARRVEAEAKRGVMGLWCQSTERLFQETAIKYLVDSKGFKLEDIVPCQDGFMILKDLWYDGILDDVKNINIEKYGISIDFLDKPFDEKIEILALETEKSLEEIQDDLSAKKLADTFIEHFGDYVLMQGQNLFVYRNDRWYDETDSKRQYKLTLYISEDLYNIVNKSISDDCSLKEDEKTALLKDLRFNTCNGSRMNDIIRHIKPNVKRATVDFNSNPFLLGFNNGVYDLLAHEFRDYKFSDYITLSTNYDYEVPNFDDPETAQLKLELIDIINSIQPNIDEQYLYLQTLASGLDGIAYQKLFLLNGQGGNGKGLTGALMDKILGEYYCQPNNGILKDVEKPNVPSPDMLNLKNKRYVNFKEVEGDVRLATLRNLTGGGKFTGRFLHQNPEQFYMSATFVMEFNNDPELVGGKPMASDYRRMCYELFPNNFTDDENKIGKVIGGHLYLKANPYYGSAEFLEKIRPVFLYLLLSVYKTYSNGVKGIQFDIPDSVRERTKKFLEKQNVFQRAFDEQWMTVEVKREDNGEPNVLDLQKKTAKLKDIWATIEFSSAIKELKYKEKRDYGRDAFYAWMESMFEISGNTKTGKLVVGVGRKCDYDTLDKNTPDIPDDITDEELFDYDDSFIPENCFSND